MALVGKYGLPKRYHKRDLERVINELEGKIEDLRKGALDDVYKNRDSEAKVQNIKKKCSKEMEKLNRDLNIDFEEERRQLQIDCQQEVEKIQSSSKQRLSDMDSKYNEGLLLLQQKLAKLKEERRILKQAVIQSRQSQKINESENQTNKNQVLRQNKTIKEMTGQIERLTQELGEESVRGDEEKERADECDRVLAGTRKQAENLANVLASTKYSKGTAIGGKKRRKTRRKRRRTKRKKSKRRRKTKRRKRRRSRRN